MTAQSDAPTTSRGLYIYGILPEDVEIAADITGVGDPPGKVTLVRHKGLAALVSEIDLERPLGTPEDLSRHQQILDASASAAPVLPMRFGAVLADEGGVTGELLEGDHDGFLAALDELGDRREFLVRGRYGEQAILQEILAENAEAARLAGQIRGTEPDATRDLRIRLGEIIGSAVTAKREADTSTLLDRMRGRCTASSVREPTDELEALSVAFLVDADQEEELRSVVGDLTDAASERIEVRLLGPMAAWDFVRVPVQEG